jgi:hypothetical protein
MNPRCTHWLGHRFVARFETKEPTKEHIERVDRIARLGASGQTEIGIMLPKVMAWVNPPTYLGDVCVRCGEVTYVKRPAKIRTAPLEVDSPTEPLLETTPT